MEYLGHTIHEDRNSNMLGGIVNDFNVKANTLLGTFNHLSGEIKNNLLDKYCCSFYGSNVSALYDSNGVHQLCVNYRKVLRRIWNLPWRTHNNLLTHISGYLPVDVVLEKRFVNFFHSGYYSDNAVLKFIFKQAVKCYSRIGRNFRHISKKYNVNILNKCQSEMVDAWRRTILGEDARIGVQIRELLLLRDSFEPWLLERHECQHVIDYLSQL